jgi:hypothetical protein
MQIFAVLDRTKYAIENVTDLNLATVKHTIVQVTNLPL